MKKSCASWTRLCSEGGFRRAGGPCHSPPECSSVGEGVSETQEQSRRSDGESHRLVPASVGLFSKKEQRFADFYTVQFLLKFFFSGKGNP